MPFPRHVPAALAALLLTATLAVPSAVAAPSILGDVVVGEAFLDDWTVVAARPGFAGGVRLVVANGEDGERVAVDVVRRAENTLAPVFSEHLELLVMDGHDGDAVLDPDLVDALGVLLDELGDDAHQAKLAEGLLTHEQRYARFPRVMHRGWHK
jgi:hypothetical protein